VILELLEAPTTEPISLEEAMAHLRVGTPEDAAQIMGTVAAARDIVETRTGQTLCPTRYRLYLPHWPRTRYTPLPKPPLLSVEAITYLPRGSVGGVVPPGQPRSRYQPLAKGLYGVDSLAPHQRRMLRTAPPAQMPPVREDEQKAIAIDFTAGASSAAEVPPALRRALLMLLRDLYDQVSEVNPAIESLLVSQRVAGFLA